ncbi:Uncharacterized protein GY17_00002511 [Cryptosporidium hominis]|uniref:Uncharacterized protein n=1 Tax=Cryptosporidium hominis TaxID=237895 RepID=A0ABX5BBP9_CRYHO|nr:hypothetical protein [Cryptosporidium hominis TU502]PPS93781.1 Uncharacterized protein GY17_00002511 [Cryptosporidium hominis]|eukprot:PPS93781.1 Uncharacterized protein GY17_00002511 [Cryptosporidium hominis]
MDLSEITFRNSLDEDLNIESWIDTTVNFNNESLLEVSFLNSKKDKIKVDKKNIISKAIERKKFKKNKKAVNRKLSDNRKKDDDIISSGRTSLILRSL